jgi:ketosteroid isomerase-like protein
MSEENVEIVRRAYEQLAERDLLGDWSWFFEEFAHDDLELHAEQLYLDETTYHGREGWAQFWRDFSSVWEEWHFDPGAFEFFDAGERVVVFVRAVGTGQGSGVEVTRDETHLWTIRDGRMLLAVPYVDRDEALEAAGLSE